VSSNSQRNVTLFYLERNVATYFGPFVSNEIFQINGHGQETQLKNISGIVIPMTSIDTFFFPKKLWA